MGIKFTRVDMSQGMPMEYIDVDAKKKSARDFQMRRVEFEPHPFDHGKFREAYKGKVLVEEGAPFAHIDASQLTRMLSCWTRDGEKPYYYCVVKKFRRGHAQHAGEWTADLRVVHEAITLAERFNKRMTPLVPIRFASAFLYQSHHNGGVYETPFWPWTPEQQTHVATLNSKEKIIVEPLLKGAFEKVNCNNGYVATKTDAADDFHEAAQAFSHWTWAETDGDRLVCDLQGVRGWKDQKSPSGPDKFWQFTDPAIHSAGGNQRFGVTDLGSRGVNAFFRTHVCNGLCVGLKRPQTVIDVGLPAARRTTFSFEFVKVSQEVHSQEDFADINDHGLSGTCYAHATATVVRAAEHRIVGRKVEAHHEMVKRIVKKYGVAGADIMTVLSEECRPRCLHFRVVDALEAAQCLKYGRPLILTFRLRDEEYQALTQFFKRSPSAVLTTFPMAPQSETSQVTGHAAVIIGEDDAQDAWLLKNSWGDDFADGGYFRVSKKLRMGPTKIIDVFFYQKDLRPEDFENFARACKEGSVRTASA